MSPMGRRAFRITFAVLVVLAAPLAALAADGSFSPHPVSPQFGLGGLGVELGDLDGNGTLDAITVGVQAEVWLNDGNATFVAHPSAPAFGGGALRHVVLGDLDGDSDLDAVLLATGGDPATIWLNDGAGSYSAHPTTPAIGGASASNIALGDVNADGHLDAVITNSDAPATVWLNDGAGGLSIHPTAPEFSSGPANNSSVALGDLDGDGDLDVVLGALSNPATVWLNDGAGAFTPHPGVPELALGMSADVALGDLNGDGHLDAVIANLGPLPETVWLNDGAGALSPQPLTPQFGAGNSTSIALGDLNGDGHLDAVVTNYDSSNTVWLNDGSGSFTAHPGTPSFGTAADFALSAALGDLDGDGDLDAVVANGNVPNTVWMNGDTTIVPTVIGDGTPQSCTEQALEIALAGGGIITFDCGGTPENPVTITVTSMKMIEANTTIDGGNSIVLSGGETTRVIGIAPDMHVALRHLTIRDGFALNEDGDWGVGGAVFNDGGVLVITDVTFENNLAGAGGAIGSGAGLLTITASTFKENYARYDGGAILIGEGIWATVTDSTFSDNIAGRHAGALATSGGRTEVTNSTFTTNRSGQAGGAIYVLGDSQTKISKSNITLNAGDILDQTSAENLSGGGIRNDGVLVIESTTISKNLARWGAGVSSAATMSIHGSLVSENFALEAGGGVYILNAAPSSSTSIERTEVSGNFAYNGSSPTSGGGIATLGNTTIIDSTVTGNFANFSGGGLYLGPTVFGGVGSAVEDSTISDNIASNGGGLYTEASVVVRGSTLSENQALFGGGFLVHTLASSLPGTALVENSTISGNVAEHRGAGAGTDRGSFTAISSTIAQNRIGPMVFEEPEPPEQPELPEPELPAAGGLSDLAPQHDRSLMSGDAPDASPFPVASLFVRLTYGPDADSKPGTVFEDLSPAFATYVQDDEIDLVTESRALMGAPGPSDQALGGAGVFNNGTMRLQGTIVADSEEGDDCLDWDGSFESHGYNLDSDGSCDFSQPTDLPTADPRLGPLEDNGGSTLTHEPLADSVVIDGGPSNCTYVLNGIERTLSIDQRDIERPFGPACDIGAVEALYLLAETPVVTPAPSGESATETVSASTGFFDPTPDGPYTCTVNYGDGSTEQAGAIDGTTCTGPEHIYLDGDNTYTLTFTVCDAGGECNSQSVEHTVNNLPPVIDDIIVEGQGRGRDSGSPRSAGDPVTFTVVASDPGVLDTLSYAFDCDGDDVYEVGPQLENTTTCPGDATRLTPEIGIQVSDDDGGVVEDTLVVNFHQTYCASRFTGQLSYRPGGCQATETSVVLTSASHTTFCRNPYTGQLTLGSEGCQRGWTGYLVPGAEPIAVCVSSFTGGMRVPSTETCNANERMHLIPAR